MDTPECVKGTIYENAEGYEFYLGDDLFVGHVTFPADDSGLALQIVKAWQEKPGHYVLHDRNAW